MIARSVGVGHTTVGEYLRRTAVIGITWPVPAELDDAELERRLFTPAGFYKTPTRVMPNWHHVHAELRFLSLGELNDAIREVLGDLNARLMRKLGASRREFFETIDRPALLPLPVEPYAYAEWRRCRVAPDYHVEVHGHFYSVPSRLIREVVEARITDTTIEVFHAGKRVAAHPRSALRRRHTTTPEHMPSAHRRYASWTPARLLSFAAGVGPGTAALVETIMRAKPHPSRASGRAWASCSWPRLTARPGSKRPASAG